MDLKKTYEELWAGGYRSRPRDHQGRFYNLMGVLNPEKGKSVIDWGCGQGRVGYQLWEFGYDVQLIDIAENALDDLVKKADGLRFINESAVTAQPNPAHYSACLDVLEHLAEDDVPKAVENIMDYTMREAYFLISLDEDNKKIDGVDYSLHLTVKPIGWWTNLLKQFGFLSTVSMSTTKHNYQMLGIVVRQ